MTKGQISGEHLTDYLDDSYVPVENPFEIKKERKKKKQKEEQNRLYLEELAKQVSPSDLNGSAMKTEINSLIVA